MSSILPNEGLFFNASGCWCANKEQIDNLFHTKLNGIVTKTCTLFPKKGNPEPTFLSKHICSNSGDSGDSGDNCQACVASSGCMKDTTCSSTIQINSKGLPNPGYYYYKEICETYFSHNKPIVLSVSWEEHNPENTCLLLKDYDEFINTYIENSGRVCPLIELNLSCPNLQHEIPAYCPSSLQKIFDTILHLELKHLFFSIKLSPYLDHTLCNQIIRVINDSGKKMGVKYVVLSNSIPNCLILDNCGIPSLSNTYGGLSGKLNKYISLSNVHYFSSRIDSTMKIIGCGGIESIQDIADYLHCGASFIQLGSCFYKSETDVLDYDKINLVITDFYSSRHSIY